MSTNRKDHAKVQEPSSNAATTSPASVSPTVAATSNIANGARAHLSPNQASYQQRRRNGTAQNISNMDLNTVPRRRAARQQTWKLKIFLKRRINSSDSVVRIPGIGRKFETEYRLKMNNSQASLLLHKFNEMRAELENFKWFLRRTCKVKPQHYHYIDDCIKALEKYCSIYPAQ